MAAPAVFTVPAGRSFVDALAAGLLHRAGGDPLALGATTVLLPTRRAGRALAEACLRANGGVPVLLPRMLPLGDLDEDELAFHASDDEPRIAAALDLPPGIPPLRRLLLLARLVTAFGERSGMERVTADQAVRLAGELARLLDQVQYNRLSFDRLPSLVAAADLAGHWQITLRFLEILTGAWPDLLAAEGALDPAVRRNRLIEAQIAAWEAEPPAGPVIAAGSTGSMPATADLLRAVAHMPLGTVVLPGLDTAMDEASWRALDPGHPQWGLSRLLGHLEIGRADVPEWPHAPRTESGAVGPAAEARTRLVSEVMRPAATSDAWRAAAFDAATAIGGVRRVDCPGPEEEARVVALMLREAAETPGRTAALVTPDRALARRVAAELRRWDIEIDDSAGTPLAETPPGTFMRLLAAMVAAEAAPVPLLALLKHPLAAGGMAPPAFRGFVRRLELAFLRGPRPEPGLEGIARGLRHLAAETERAERRHGLVALSDDVEALAVMLAPLATAMAAPRIGLDALLTAQAAVAEALATTDAEPGAGRLWAGEAGEALARFMGELHAAAGGLPPVEGASWPAMLEALLDGHMVRPRWGRHPRLAIWGPLEARLQHADHLILGGLNEGTWPPQPGVDPWMSRPMRSDFGLPALEQRIGLSAHDFAQAFCAPTVTLTRARRVEGAPTVASRWLLRLESVLDAAGVRLDGQDAARWLGWQERLDGGLPPVRFAPPRPCPPVAVRPRRLSVTRIETWLRDPYAVYARHILDLSPLDPLDADPGAAERGTAIHAALDRFLRETADGLPADPAALVHLLAIDETTFGAALDRPGLRAFWWPRFERIAAWFVAEERKRRPRLAATATEVQGRLEIAAPAGLFTVTAKADRIDRLHDGGLAVIDYKTGSPPSRIDVERGAAPQLPLEAAIVRGGGFERIEAGSVAELAVWRLSGGDPPGKESDFAKDLDADALAEAARDGLARWVAAFDDPAMPYLAQPRPDLLPRFSDYAHLARVAEWGRGGGGET